MKSWNCMETRQILGASPLIHTMPVFNIFSWLINGWNKWTLWWSFEFWWIVKIHERVSLIRPWMFRKPNLIINFDAMLFWFSCFSMVNLGNNWFWLSVFMNKIDLGILWISFLCFIVINFVCLVDLMG